MAKAQVHAAPTRGDFRAVGETDAAGACVLALENHDHRLAVRHPDAAPYVSALTSPPPGELEVRLRRSGEIRGVVLRDGAPAERCLVIAWPSTPHDRRLTYAKARSAAIGAPDALRCLTDGRGEFVLGGLDHDLPHAVFAASTGAVCSNSARGVRAGQAGVVVELSTAFAARLDFGVDPACGAALAAGATGGALEVLDQDAVRLPLDLLPLLGVSTERGGEFDPAAPVFLFRSTRPGATRVGPVRLRVAQSGFLERTVEFWCDPFATEIPRVDAALAPVDNCMGGLEVRAPAPFEGGAIRYVGHLSLVSGSAEHRVELERIGGLSSLCLPCGRYEARIVNDLGGPPLSLGSVELQAHSRRSLDLGAAALGGLRIRVQRDGPETFRGHLPLDIARVVPGATRQRSHDHIDLWAPSLRDEYWIGALPPGAYLLSINGPFLAETGAPDRGDGWIGPIEVREGDFAQLDVRMVE